MMPVMNKAKSCLALAASRSATKEVLRFVARDQF
jgi:hypothetical protein